MKNEIFRTHDSGNGSEGPEEKSILTELDLKNLPRHVAVIMDGNGRWAARKRLPRIEGHRRGIQAVREVITLARELEISILTLYAFSNENWSRPAPEINQLMTLLKRYLLKEVETMMSNEIRFRAVGQIDRLPGAVADLIQSVEEKTRDNKKMTLVLALSYGGRTEIVDTVKRLAEDLRTEKISVKDLDETLFSEYLYTGDIPDPDLMIRTSGEVRISNFFLWQLAYTELYFTRVLWPDFKREDFLLALLGYQQRERRFGLVSKWKQGYRAAKESQ
ncbi:MAG TPA: isoprenyl transferase [Nitrospira sp.]|nr:isoprenyl transferase [Candidatus Manganitrophaceae bacterium]